MFKVSSVGARRPTICLLAAGGVSIRAAFEGDKMIRLFLTVVVLSVFALPLGAAQSAPVENPSAEPDAEEMAETPKQARV